jgi:hypothetical protein
MSEAINAHKKMAMGITEGNVMKKGGKVKKFAVGGLADGGPKKPEMLSGKPRIATMKKGGKPALMIAVAIGKKAARGR